MAPLDLLVAWLVVLGILGAGLVALHIFEPNLVLVLGSGLTVAAVLATRHPIAWREGRIGGALLVVLLLGMLVRLPPYPHPNGGQDQGLYVSLSQVFEKRGGYVFDDPLRAQLSVDQAEIYRAAGGLDLPGVIPTARGDVIHFYPLHPVYMSLAATVMGSTHRVASLTLFAVLGLLALALLAGEITGRRDVALLAAALAAAHPGLSFFSKLPVAEMVALAFTATAAYYLARFARLADRGSVEPCWLILSTGSFLCACLTRPNGVFLLPALVVTVIALLVSDLPPQARKCILLYWPAALVSIALSYALFSMYWGELFWDVALGRVVGHFFGQRPLLEVVAVCAGSTILLGMLGRGRDRRERLHRLLERRGPHAVVVIWAICLAVLAWRAWVVLPDRDLLLRGLYLIEPGPTAVWRLVPYRLALYLSPLGALLLALFPFIWRRTLRGPICLLFVLVATVLLAFSRLPYSLYAYYYDRYLHGELVPFGLVLLAIVLGELRLRWRSFADAAAILVVAYFSVFTLFQVGKREGADPDLFERLRTGREEGDLFFLDSSTVFRSPAIATTLRFDLDLPVFPVASALDLPVAPLAELAREHRRAYLLSGEREPLHSFLTLDRVLRYRESYLHDGGGHMLERLYQLRPLGRMQTTGLASSWSRAVLPLRYSVVEQPLYLYRVDTDEWARGDFTTAVRFESETLPSGWNDVRLQIGDPWKASAGLARVARPEVLDWPHPHSALVHGPYHYLRAGSHRADFRLRSAGASGDAIVVGIDVAANQGARVLASRCLRSEDFPSGESYHTFSLPFESVEDLSGVEYRVWYRGVGAIWSDYVDLTSVAGGASPSVAGREAAPTPPGGDTCWLPPGR